MCLKLKIESAELFGFTNIEDNKNRDFCFNNCFKLLYQRCSTCKRPKSSTGLPCFFTFNNKRGQIK